MQCLLWRRVESPKILELAAHFAMRGFTPSATSATPQTLAGVKIGPEARMHPFWAQPAVAPLARQLPAIFIRSISTEPIVLVPVV